MTKKKNAATPVTEQVSDTTKTYQVSIPVQLIFTYAGEVKDAEGNAEKVLGAMQLVSKITIAKTGGPLVTEVK